MQGPLTSGLGTKQTQRLPPFPLYTKSSTIVPKLEKDNLF